MDALENAVRLPASVYGGCVFCTPAFMGEERLPASRGVQPDVRQDPDCIASMSGFARYKPDLWNEDSDV